MRLPFQIPVQVDAGPSAAPSPPMVPKKSWSEAGLLIVTLVFTLNIYFVFIRRKLQPIKAKGQWLITCTLIGSYFLFLWTCFAVTFGRGKVICEAGFHVIFLASLLQTGPLLLRHMRNLCVYYQAHRITLFREAELVQFLEPGERMDGGVGGGGNASSRDSFPKRTSPFRQSSLVAWLILGLALLVGIMFELNHLLETAVMVEPAVQCLSEASYPSQARAQRIFWAVFHALESLVFLSAFLLKVPEKYFPLLLESKYQLFSLIVVTITQSIFFLQFDKLGPVSRAFHMSKEDMTAFLIFVRITLHYFWDGFIPLVRSFTRNFQASVDSYVADALECKQKGMYIAQSASSTASSNSGPSSGLYNPNEKIKFLLKDMLGLEAFQNFLEIKSIGLGGGPGDQIGLDSLLKWYEIETMNIQLEEIPVQKSEEGGDPIRWNFQHRNLNFQMQRIYKCLEDWNLLHAFDASIDNAASLMLSEAMERDFALRLPNNVRLTSDSANESLLKSPMRRILANKVLLNQFIIQQHVCISEALQQCQLILLHKLQEYYQHFLRSEACQHLLKSWMKKHVIACLLIRIRMLNLPSEEGYLDLITKESLQFVVLQTLGFSS